MMISTNIISILVFTCFVGNTFGQDVLDPLEERYITECQELHPSVNRSDVKAHQWQKWFCTWYCNAIDGEKIFFDPITKEDGAECVPMGIPTDIGYLKGGKFQCLNNACVRQSDVQDCNSALKDDQLKSLKDDECTVTCNGIDGTIITVDKSVGSSCVVQENYLKETVCNQIGLCVAEPNTVPVPTGAFDSTAAAANATCIQRNKGDIDMQIFSADPACEFICIYSAKGKLSYEYLTFPDGTACADGQVCTGGICLPQEVFAVCEHNTKRMDIEECEVTCWSNTNSVDATLPVDFPCVSEMGKGTCDSEGECIA